MINKTIARKNFKKKFGQQNHFLITTLIGLDLVDQQDVSCPESFSTSWNPQDKSCSVSRSRDFILQSFLFTAVDGIDFYISKLNTEPLYITKELHDKICGAGQSVYNKVKVVSDFYNIDKRLSALCLLLITLRNNLLHSMAENEVEERELLLSSQDFIKHSYCGLDVTELLTKTNTKKAPTFKEVASLIKATHQFVEIVDGCVLSNLDIDLFLLKATEFLLKKQKNAYKKYRSIQEAEKRKRFVKNLLQNHMAISEEELEDSALNKLLNIKLDIACH